MDRAKARWNVGTSPLAGDGYLFSMRVDSCQWPLFFIELCPDRIGVRPPEECGIIWPGRSIFSKMQRFSHVFLQQDSSATKTLIVFASKAIFIGDDIAARFGAKDAFNR